MIEKDVKFQFKGSRNYVQGPDIFNEILTFFSSEEISDLQLNIYKVIRSQICKAYFSNSESQIRNIEQYEAQCTLKVNGELTWVRIVSKSDNQAAIISYPYDEEKVLSLCKVYDNTINLLEKSPYTFIETVVAMNKYLHQCLFQSVEGRWLFVRLDLPKVLYDRDCISVVLKHNLNYRLTKSEIHLKNIVIGEIYFSLST